MKKIIFIVCLLYLVWHVFFKIETVSYGEGIFAPNVPQQQMLNDADAMLFKDFTITPLATFKLAAKVLSKKNYNSGVESELSPTDLALGWGRMSDEVIINQLDISQSGRWYRWNTKSNAFPIPRNEIQVSSANMHIIPKNDRVSGALAQVRQGDIVNLKGFLVRVDRADGWRWISSLTREDAGAGACELFLVEDLEIEYY